MIFAISGPLRIGDNGRDVAEVHSLLKGVVNQIAIDGRFGRQTDQAVRTFQERRGLTVDGVVGPKTTKALGRDYKVRTRVFRTWPGSLPLTQGPGGKIPTAKEIVANALAPELTLFMGLIKDEIRETGAPEDKIQNAIKAVDDVLLPGLIDALNDWEKGEVDRFTSLDLNNDILDFDLLLRGKVLTYLKDNGGDVRGVLARIEKFDDTAIVRIVEFMFMGLENADGAAWDIHLVMQRALAR